MKTSSGILLYRFKNSRTEVMLVHPGGPLWTKKDTGAWSIPKGEFDPETEEPVAAAVREFSEETGQAIQGDFISLGTVRQKSGKIVHCFALESDFDSDTLQSNTFEMEWPPRSGIQKSFPEIDRAEWFDLNTAALKINTAQVAFIGRLLEFLSKKGIINDDDDA